MKKSKLLLSTLLLGGLFLVGCSNSTPSTSSSSSEPSSSSSVEKTINYSVKVVDLDGEVVFEKNLTTKNKNSLFLDLNREATVVADASDLGHYIYSINGTISDPNYYLALYENDTYSLVGVDEVTIDEGDKFTFKSECFNLEGNGYGGTMTATDLKVDKIIYSSYKKLKEVYKDMTYVPYDLLFAYSKLEKLGYDVDSKKIFPDAVKSNYDNVSFTNMSIGDTFKTAISLYALEKDLTGVKEYISSSSFDLTEAFVETSAVYLDDVMSLLGVQASNYADYTTLLSNLTLDVNETSCMYVSAMKRLDNYNFDNFVTGIKSALTSNGFSYTMNFGGVDYTACNASSTSQAILALTTLGKNLKSEEFKVGQETLIDVLLKYYDEEKGLFFDSEGDTYNLSYAEPQSLAALISYKIFNDKGSVNIYRG